MLCIAEIASCRTVSPAAVQLRKLVAGGEIPDPSVCSAPGWFIPEHDNLDARELEFLTEKSQSFGNGS